MSTMTSPPAPVHPTTTARARAARRAARSGSPAAAASSCSSALSLFLLLARRLLGRRLGRHRAARHARADRDRPGRRAARPSGTSPPTVATDGDTGAMVERIQRLNALDSGMLTAGQKIRVPATE